MKDTDQFYNVISYGFSFKLIGNTLIEIEFDLDLY